MIEALLIANTVDTGFKTFEDIHALQQHVKEPAVIFVESDTKKPVNAYFIDATTQEELKKMDESKRYYTKSIPFGEYVRIDDRYFFGSDVGECRHSEGCSE